MIKVGQVSLVGAGPGDWRLLTLGAEEVLENAEVVIYDRLASDQIMKYAAMGAEKIYVGKASNQHTLQQEEINELIVQKAKEGKLSLEEMTGGTFTISNGGVFGSMLSTPIINPPQSAILGVHATKERAVVENGQIVIRPMNYLAMSYDHRIIDGREAVLGLVAMKEALEDPARILFDI